MRLLAPEVLTVLLPEDLLDHSRVLLLKVAQRHQPHHLLPPLRQLPHKRVLNAEQLGDEVFVQLEVLLEHVGDTDDVDRPAGGVRLELLTFLVLAVEGVFGAVGEGAEALGLLLAGATGNDGLGDVVALEE